MAMEIEVNGERRALEVDPTTPLLWVLRETLALTGTKFGCGAAQCGACTVHVDGRARRSCVTPLSAVAGRRVTTIEGLEGSLGSALERAWIDAEVPQCGYCQTGQSMSAAVLLAERALPTDAEIDACLSGTVCRCATYVRIRAAVHAAARLHREGR
jgi:isoquinoline 1-oxidoreductase alpha subunit